MLCLDDFIGDARLAFKILVELDTEITEEKVFLVADVITKQKAKEKAAEEEAERREQERKQRADYEKKQGRNLDLLQRRWGWSP